jgi:hypothetical protein
LPVAHLAGQHAHRLPVAQDDLGVVELLLVVVVFGGEDHHGVHGPPLERDHAAPLGEHPRMRSVGQALAGPRDEGLDQERAGVGEHARRVVQERPLGCFGGQQEERVEQGAHEIHTLVGYVVGGVCRDRGDGQGAGLLCQLAGHLLGRVDREDRNVLGQRQRDPPGAGADLHDGRGARQFGQ